MSKKKIVADDDQAVIEKLDHDLEEELDHSSDAQQTLPLEESVRQPNLTGRDKAPEGSNQTVVDIGAEEKN